MARKKKSVTEDIIPKLQRLRLLSRCERECGIPTTTLKLASIQKRGIPIKYWDSIREWAKNNLKGDIMESTYVKKTPQSVGIRDFLKNKNKNNESGSNEQSEGEE